MLYKDLPTFLIDNPAYNEETSSLGVTTDPVQMIPKPVKRSSSTGKPLNAKEQINYFLDSWLGDAVIIKSEDNPTVRLNKCHVRSGYYHDLYSVGALAIDKEKLRMKRMGYDWANFTYGRLNDNSRNYLLNTFKDMAVEFGLPVDRYEDNWLAKKLISTMYHSRQSRPQKKKNPKVCGCLSILYLCLTQVILFRELPQQVL